MTAPPPGPQTATTLTPFSVTLRPSGCTKARVRVECRGTADGCAEQLGAAWAASVARTATPAIARTMRVGGSRRMD